MHEMIFKYQLIYLHFVQRNAQATTEWIFSAIIPKTMGNYADCVEKTEEV